MPLAPTSEWWTIFSFSSATSVLAGLASWHGGGVLTHLHTHRRGVVQLAHFWFQQRRIHVALELQAVGAKLAFCRFPSELLVVGNTGRAAHHVRRALV